ncbi:MULTISPECIES: iron-siderophore ABC transporter substrate-binding protein [Pseudonocardia]|uniref:ABC transporter substrate-binding protein n=2 Tax=Pseudonocardia TaxID=1847 RepID=A0ABQ0RU84_9PSEU|nr:MULTISPECIES: iron-siderophore ABC transporter substrate-binding protein [Pseudonocardia]OSY41578.1 putative siderophore-binding lipoprotein YfiY precursor [Pseudonocardia autotrophica]TDN71532.1 iron complex transport system substrate-binding protein [Pseudonocardia autotrophica]BBG02212.1 ABC transporter substrate-binding protein [Pseudonocardia autotrophica]GEC24227.1 ABC transporter substrate-binding protein [Pseudonocardia saturnea]
MSTALTRAALAAPLAALLLVAGCGAAGPADAPAPDAGGTGAFPARIDHAYGTTEIPAEPQRVVTLGLSDQDPLLALGVRPIAVSQWYGDQPHATWPWAQDELGDAQPVVLNGGVRNEEAPPLEEIAALDPDLILSLYNGTTAQQYEQLSAIAPTVVPDEGFTDFTITWQEATRATGEALGREQEALDLVAATEQKFAEAARDHPGFAGKRAVVAERFEPGASVVRSGNDIRALFFTQLGFESPTEIAGIAPDQYGEIKVSDELMGELSRDLLVWNIGSSPELRPEIENNPVYPTLPVVQQGRVLWVEDPVVSGAFSWGTILSLDYALEKLVPQIAETLD